MKASERSAAIERELRIRGHVKVSTLARILGASEISIRRDLNVLQERGIAKRNHGGASFAGDRSSAELTASTPAQFDARGWRRLPGTPRTSPASAAIIGIVVPDSSYYYSGVIAGAEEMADTLGYRLVLAVSGYSGEEERRQILRLVGIGARGLVVTPSVHASIDSATYDLLAGVTIPTVLMERKVDAGRLDVVYSEHSIGAIEAMKYLLDIGHCGIVLLTRDESATSAELIAGFNRAASWFIPERSGVFLVPDAPEQRKFLESTLKKSVAMGATAVLVHTDEMAITVSQILTDQGIDIPGHLSIIAYDDEVAALADPPLDAVAPPKREVGRSAVQLCVERIESEGQNITPRHIALLPKLILRSSSGPIDDRHHIDRLIV